MIVTKNTYPVYKNVAHAEKDDIVHWEYSSQGFKLIRYSDKKTLFQTPAVDLQGNLRSNSSKQPVLTGVIAANRSKNYILEIH